MSSWPCRKARGDLSWHQTLALSGAGATVIVGARTLDKARAALAGIARVELDAIDLFHRGEAVSKTEIQRRLWPDTFVSESSLTGLAAQVRKALADDRRQERFLRTVHGFGYAFSGEVGAAAGKESAPPARLVWEDTVFPLQPGDNLLGRSGDASVRIDAPGVSRRHARIVLTDDGATIEDLASKNGTFVGERRLDAPTLLQDGDRLSLGRQLLVFRRAGSAAATWTESPSPRTCG